MELFSLLSLLFLIALLLYWIKYRIINRNVFEKIEGFESFDKPYLIIGNGDYCIGRSINVVLENILKRLNNKKKTCKAFVFSKLLIFAIEPKDIKTILTSPYCYDKANAYNFAKIYEGLFVANTHRWKIQRRLVNTTFNTQSIKSFIPLFNTFAKNLVFDLDDYAEKNKDTNILHPVGVHVADLTLRTAVGSDRHSIDLSISCCEIIEKTMKVMGKRLVESYSNLFKLLVQKAFNRVTIDSILFRRLLRNILPVINKTKKEYLDANSYKIESENEIRYKNSDSYLKRLIRIQLQNYISSREMYSNILTIFVAGSDTSTNAISNIVLILAMHPDIQEQAYKEVCDILGMNYDGIVDFEMVDELKFLDRVIKETFRIIPVVPIIGRRTAADIQLEDGIVPAGTDIFIPIHSIHKNKSIWGENAEQFNPDNFLPENFNKMQRCSFIPFSYGLRNCIGLKYAHVFIRIAIINLIKNYKFSTNLELKDLKFGFGLTSFLLNGHNVRIVKRNNHRQN